MATVELFGFAQSTYVRTARLVCEYKSIDYVLLPLEFGQESHRIVHPFLRMPAMRHSKLLLFETLAIATYLNEQFPGPNLAAGTAAKRAHILQWISAANDYVYQGVVAKLAKAESIDPKIVDATVPLLRPFDQALAQHDYLVGDTLTLADLFLFPMLSYTNAAVATPEWLAPLPQIATWLHRLEKHPSTIATAE